MFPLAGKKFPSSADELETALREALTDVFTLPEKGGSVSVAAGKYPAIKTVRLDLDGASISATDPPPKPTGTGKRETGITVDKLEISGHPIRYQKATLDLDVTARGLVFDFDRDKKGRPVLVLTDAAEGKVKAKIDKEDLQTLLLEGATLAAKQQGVTVQDLKLELTASGPRSVSADVRVKAKKMLMSGVVLLHGDLEIDAELNATVTGLTCTGEGMIGSAAAGFLGKKIQSFNGTTIPLMAFSLGDVALRDLKIKVDKSLHISAAFGTQ